MTIPRKQLWRIAFVVAGVAMAIGGSQHPDSDAEDSLRDELATMTASDTWVSSHTLLAIGSVLLAVGLWSAYRNRSWPDSTRSSLRVGATAMSLYVVETVFHLASVLEADALANGEAAPVTFTHIGLALVLYPVSGIAFAWLNTRVFTAASLPMKTFGVVGVVAGLLHAVSVPLTIVLPDTEFTPVFAGAGMLIAIWSIGLGLGGLSSPARASTASRSEPVRASEDSDHENSHRRAEIQL